MNKNSRHRSRNIRKSLNKDKVRALKLIKLGIAGGDVTPTQLKAAEVTLKLLREYQDEEASP